MIPNLNPLTDIALVLLVFRHSRSRDRDNLLVVTVILDNITLNIL